MIDRIDTRVIFLLNIRENGKLVRQRSRKENNVGTNAYMCMLKYIQHGNQEEKRSFHVMLT